ncbi:LPXTG cell wall anchor domain-containing protein [Thomasclavelia spiroformis DSM 1552]|uniref:beta-N-acetylhexosaminidase n=1 Tax=Thomasclavelia spiroformis DSM 1552 TaxID=428126 RepID=B1C1A8_9FIRM|nr:glycoside hydrolase family 3 N-terminal domain-containing protein [Thomasclavelia spiroformis]EDS75163.1 LPXTG-motif cell wall anchor domain protein [Thomasclavelia spiroformis DSM 1552]UWO88925.1 LPXTG cell wall anchor domain-containing protein [Thomasclavelia spiroformis DSM 1552]
MKLGKKIVSLMMVLAMIAATIFSVNISNAAALTNEQKAQELVAKMTLEEKIGQKIMLSFRSGWTMKDGTKISSVQNINDEIYEIIGKYDIGSVILFAANFASDASINVELTDGLQKAAIDPNLGENNIPLIIATDQEGGIVYRLTGGTALPGNMAVGATNDPENAFKAGKVIGSELSAVGVNTNFAPDADVNNNPNNPVIGLRSFSSSPQLAAKFTTAYIEGVQSQNIATTAKHFPGHGNVATDSHTGLPSIDATKDELYQIELVPFQAAIAAGTDMIMTAHIQFPNVVEEKIYSSKQDEHMSPPATLSREILTDLLRNELNFDGVIVTDSMTMNGVANYFDVNERNLLAVKAGVDILDIPFNDISSWADMETKLIPLIDAFVDAYTKEDGYNGIKLSIEELDKSVERILTLKYNRNIMELVNDNTSLQDKKAKALEVVGSVENRETERLISAKGVTVVKNENDVLPLKLTSNSKVLFATTYSRNNNRFVLAWERAKQAGIIPEGADYKILQHYNWTGLNDKVNSAINSDGSKFQGTNRDLLDWCDVLVHASEISKASGIDGYIVGCPQLFTNYCKNLGKQTVVISLNHPYDVQAFPDADGILAVYGTTSLGLDITESFGGGTVGATAAFSPNLTAGTEVVLGTFGASGKLPVDIPKYVPGSKVYSTDEIVYKLGYGIEYEALAKDPDRTALVEAINKVETLNKNNYTEESWQSAKNELETLNDILKVAKNVNLTHKLAQAKVDENTQELKNQYDKVLELLVPISIDKTALKIALDLANVITDEDLANVVPVVVEEFKVARDKANEVYNDASASQDKVDAVFDRLASIMQKLEFFKGDKTALKAFIDKVSGLEAAKYTEATWTPFNDALTAAASVYEDENAMQEEVNNAYNELVTAFLKLRLIPDKSLLEDLINQANELNSANYTKATFDGLTKALNEAKAVFNNPNATQVEVDNAKDVLTKAIANLQTVTVDNTIKAPVNNGDTTVSVKTGDESLVGMFAGIALLSVAGYALLRRKEND